MFWEEFLNVERNFELLKYISWENSNFLFLFKSGYEMKIFIFRYDSKSKTRKKTVDRFLISFLVPEISAFKEV